MVEILLGTPVLIKILVSLTLIILINKFLSNQILGIFIGTLLLAVWAGHNLKSGSVLAWARFSNTDNIFLMIVVFIIIILSSQMKETRMMDDLVKSITSRFSRNTSMAVLPAVIGLMPMPGGAVFSAPLVNSCDPDLELTPSLKTRINYWFRHVWEYWWPLYPGVLLAIDISGLQVSHFMALMFPVTLFSIVGAWFFLLRKTGNRARAEGTDSPGTSSAGPGFIYLISPIIMIVGIYAILSILFPPLLAFSRYLPITIGIVSAVVFLQVIRPLPRGKWKKIIFSRKNIDMVLLVALIRIYGAFIEGRLPDGTLLMDLIRNELSGAGLSPYLLIMLIPFLCGVSTGIAIGTVGAAFPIVISLLGPEPGFALLASTTVLAYSFGHVGQLMSPVHVCLLVSNEYFKVGLGRSLTGIIRPSIVVLAAALLLSRLYLLIL